MPEETAASSSGSMEEKPCSSTAVQGSDSTVDVMEEAKKLIGTGKRHLVMGDVMSAVNVFQEASGMLAAKYGDTADECGEVFFLYGKSLLELARMENTVLGNALEGVPEESSEEGEKPDNPNIESADNLDEKTRDELRMQVYDAMAEKENRGAETEPSEGQGELKAEEEGAAKSPVKNGLEKSEAPVTEVKSPASGEEAVKVVVTSPAKETGEVEGPQVKGPAKETGAVKSPVKESPAKETGAVKSPVKESPAKETGEVEGPVPAKETGVEKSPAPVEEAVKASGSEQNGNDKTEEEKMEEGPANGEVGPAKETGVEKSPASGEAVKASGSEEQKGDGKTEEERMEEGETKEPVKESVVKSPVSGEEAAKDKTKEAIKESGLEKDPASGEKDVKVNGSEQQGNGEMEKMEEGETKEAVKKSGLEKSPASGVEAVKDSGSEEQKGNGETEEEKMEEDGEAEDEGMEEEGDDDDDDDDDDAEEGTAEDKESEEEVGNLQLAWEMLELAKVIFKRKECVEDQLMAAQAYLKLGEVSAESGNYPQALEDFQDCLTLQLKHLPPHNRLLAETHYQLGMTLCYTGHYDQAIQHYGSSIKVIESRLAMLQEVIDKAEGEEGAKEEKSELEELKLLLPDITEKVEDAKESQKTASSASEAIQQTLGGASTPTFPGENGGPSSSTAFAVSQIPVKPSEGASSSTTASDISHLVRKKRKPEEESPKKDTDAKKAKQETSVNGCGDSASNGNGVQAKEAQEPVNSSASVESSA